MYTLHNTVCPGSKYPILYSNLLYKMGYLLPGHIVHPVPWTNLKNPQSYILCVQEVVTPFYIVTYYIKWGDYFLDTRYINTFQKV